MAIVFPSFNISSAISNATSQLNSLTRSVPQVFSGLQQGVQRLNRTINTVGNVANFISNPGRAIKNILDVDGNGSIGLSDVGAAIRSTGLSLQGVGIGASPTPRTTTRAIVNADDSPISELEDEWRVRLQVPSIFNQGEVIKPLFEKTNSHMVFPFNPVILYSSSASYSNVHPTHTNYPYHAYQNSQVDNITITGEFFSESQDDALYWVACIHFLRSITKMFYGNSNPQGNPPALSYLKGYGKHVLNNVPVVITNFTVDLPAEVDYIQCNVDGEINYVPTQSQITVTCSPNYSRRAVAEFSLNDYVNGTYNKSGQGFI